MDKINNDKIFAKYYDEPTAYKKLRDFFLDHKAYTHMVIAPDDLVITKDAFNMLLEDTKKYNLAVLSGICNFTWQEMDKYPCYQMFLIGQRASNYMTQEQLDGLAGNILQMIFEGFACCWIRRDVIEQIELDGILWDNGTRHSFDNKFAQDCAKLNIPIYVDKRVKMLHLANRAGVGLMENWGVGVFPPKMIFQASFDRTN